MLTTRSSAEANHELDELAFNLAYQTIRWSPLWPELENSEWDELAERLKRQVRRFVDDQIDRELTKLEKEKNDDDDNG